MKKLGMILTVAAFILISCNGIGTSEDISPQKAREMINSGSKDLLLLDVRTVREYKSGHIKGSTLIPVNVLSAKVEEIGEYRDREVLIYCASGMRSSKATNILAEKGFKKIYNMDGGIMEWGRLGYEIEK